MIDEEEADANEGHSFVLLTTEESLQSVGRQITAAESARNHVPFDKLGDHLNALVAFLGAVSGTAT